MDPSVADHVPHPVDRFPPTPPKSYADAVEQKERRDLSDQIWDIDEEAIKESPPRSSSDASAPRPLGEVLDEDEQNSPRPVTPTPLTRKPIPGLSYADAASPSVNSHERAGSDKSLSIDSERRAVAAAERSPKSPLRRVKKRIPSTTLDGGSREVSDSMTSKVLMNKYDGIHSDSDSSPSIDQKEENAVTMNGQTEKRVQIKEPQRDPVDTQTPDTYKEEHSKHKLIHWAPLVVPIKRRLQTAMVLAHTLSIVSCVAIFFFLCAIPIFWPLVLPYLIYVLTSKAGTNGLLTHRSERIRRAPFWRYFASYFPMQLHRTVPLPPTRKYLFGYHPHGIISHGAFAAFATDALGFSAKFPGITNTLLTLESNFRIPIYRDWALRIGLGSVSKESCMNLLSRGGPNGEGMGRAITIVIGGAAESLDSVPEEMRLVLKKRKGFVKLAVRTGADLVPVLAFGENELYQQVDSASHPAIHQVQVAIKSILGFTVPLFHARGIFNYDYGLIPYRKPVNIVVGRPILVRMEKEPSQAYIDELHGKYMEELCGIWEEHKGQYGRDTRAMKIIE